LAVRAGEIQARLGQTAEAEGSYQRALELLEPLAAEPGTAQTSCWPLLADLHGDLGSLYDVTGRFTEAESAQERAIAIWKALLLREPERTTFQFYLSGCLHNLALLHCNSRPAKAEDLYHQALAIRERLTQAHPEVTKYKAAFAGSLNELAILASQERPGDAVLLLERAVNVLKELVDGNPRSTKDQSSLAGSLNNLALLYSAIGRPAEAERTFHRASAIEETLARNHPERIEYRLALGGIYGNLGSLSMDRREDRAALELYERADRALREVLKQEPRHAQAQQFLANTEVGRAWALARLGRAQEALAEADRALGSAAAVRLPGMGGVCFTAARVHSILAAAPSGDGGPPTEQGQKPSVGHAEIAVGLLARARKLRLFDNPGAVGEVRSDRDFNPLRSRPDFQALIDEVTFPADPMGR
jgi:tetratricopeptide (TPR) repeat protein